MASQMDAELQTHIELESITETPSADDRLQLHYQAVFEMNDHRLIGFEALVRLAAQDGSLIPLHRTRMSHRISR